LQKKKDIDMIMYSKGAVANAFFLRICNSPFILFKKKLKKQKAMRPTSAKRWVSEAKKQISPPKSPRSNKKDSIVDWVSAMKIYFMYGK
jgi:hypothetical protein